MMLPSQLLYFIMTLYELHYRQYSAPRYQWGSQRAGLLFNKNLPTQTDRDAERRETTRTMEEQERPTPPAPRGPGAGTKHTWPRC